MRKFYVIDKYKDLKIEIPQRQTKHSAGYDLATMEETIIKPQEIVLIKTGLKVRMADDEVLLVFPRSSLGIKKGLTMANNVGVVDADYFNNSYNEGHIMIPLLNFSKKSVTLEKNERVAQGIFVKYLKTEDDQINDLKRKGGFGSSDS
ncbi:MAG: dUTP diphosphatase [Acholeplasmataceae bacterium]|jgi:dUTP pyrophosphatase|nr:dUTP diphosphatase [Acholeplasmataceae bacterium]